jgi:4,4'-diaponeurosporenoate glycosyltransferase
MPFNYYTIVIGAIIGLILFFKLPRLSSVKVDSEVSEIDISVIIPVRNEEANLPGLLGDLQKQTYRIHEIICVDDNSEDATAQIIKDYNAKCVQLHGLQNGWKGKPWACQNGAETATGKVLIFLDADVRLSTSAIESLVRRYQENGKPISVQPYHTVKKPHEFFSLIFNLIKICATAMSFLGTKKTFGLYGPMFLVQKELFDRFNGFEAVKDNAAEDLNLGRFYNKQGVDIDLLMGGSEIRFCMYPKSFKDLFEGWSKNFSRGSISIRWWVLILIFIWIASLNAVPLEIIRNIAWGNSVQLMLLGGIYILFAAMVYRIAYRAGSYPIYVCLLYPIYLIVFEVIFLYSIIATFITKTTTWKGRKL